MNCADFRDRIHAFVDGALAPETQAACQCHLANCVPCREQVAAVCDLENDLRATIAAEPVPAGLWQRIWRRIDAGAATPPRKRRFSMAAWAAAAAVLLAAFLVQGLPGSSDASVAEIPISELRTFVDSRRELDVATTDAEKLRLWFTDKVDFAPPRPPAVDHLVGGRLCYFLGRRVASYMYREDGRYVSLYIFSGSDLEIPPGRARTLAGNVAADLYEDDGFFHLVWTPGPIVYSLVAELPAPRLLDVARGMSAEFQTRGGGPKSPPSDGI